MELDEIDRQILQVLEEDPRISNKKISEIVGLTPQAVGIRIKKLKEGGIIGGIKILKALPKRRKPIKEIKRFQTKIPGFDQHIGGGFPDPSTIILLGESGAGTSTFCLKLLWTAINEGMHVVYFAIERPRENVIQQLKSFGWEPPKSEEIQVIDVFDIITDRVHEFETVSHMDILQIYREMLEQQKDILPSTDIIFFDNFTELIKLVKGSPIEMDLINQLGRYMMKHKRDLMTVYVLKPHIIEPSALLTLESYADCVIRLRKEIEGQQIRRFLLLEKMLLTDHTIHEIEFHITNEGIILDEYLLQHRALQNPPSNEGRALFQIKELDYLTRGLQYGTTWVLEIDGFFPIRDLIKLYAKFFMDGLERGKRCRFVFSKMPVRDIVEVLARSFEETKLYQKFHQTLEKLITQQQLLLMDVFQKAIDLPEASLLVPTQMNELGEEKEQISSNTYYGFMMSDLKDLILDEKQILLLYKRLKSFYKPPEGILLVTFNPQLHSEQFTADIRSEADGLIKLGVSREPKLFRNKYLQVLKTPDGTLSPRYWVNVSEDPPYFQLI